MAIEKMVMMNVVGLKEYINDISREVVLMENVDIVNALNEIRESHFTLSVVEENVDELVDMSLIQPITDHEDYDSIFKKIEELENIYHEDFKAKKEHLGEPFDFNKCAENINKLYENMVIPYKKIENLNKEIEKINEFYRNFVHIKDLDVQIETLQNLRYFTYTFGILSKENVKKLKRNYENITAIVLHTGSSSDGEVYLVISPKELELETNRILRSLNFYKIDMPNEFTGTPMDIIKKLKLIRKKIESQISDLDSKLSILKEENNETVSICYSRLKLQKKIKEVKKQMVSSNNFFYFSGWVPKSDKKEIRKALRKYENSIIVFKEEKDLDEDFSPPTKLKNNIIYRPFEYLVKMYGIPSYQELDPTAFLSLTYMFLFGAMFGDIGQGFILFIAGILLKKKSELFGNILNRLGVSSMIFGVLYGTLFGFEHIIPALLFSPSFEDNESINTILISAVIIGIFLLIVSYIYSIINATKQRDLKEGLFGRNGVAGLLFYVMLLLLGGNIIGVTEGIQNSLIIVTLIVLIGFMVAREPLSNLILNKRPLYHEPISSYYIESSFDILETLLNMLSGTVSFIRVGAFALTHVGLFVAFHTIAELIGNLAGSAITIVLGNIIIIGLEGLIVLIQGLRLEYYELFSKYYKGEGVEFNPIRLNDKT